MQERTDSRTLEMIKQLLSKARISTKRWAEEPCKVLIVADQKSIRTPNSQFALCMAINVLTRLHPVLTQIGVSISGTALLSVDVPLFTENKILDAILDFINKLQLDCKVECVDPLHEDWDAVLSIGPSNLAIKNTISIASDGWTAYVSANELATTFTDNTNPIGAYVAACIGGMEVFKKVFLKKSNLLLPEKTPFDVRWRLKLIKDQLSFSAFDYRVNGGPTNNPSLPLTTNVGKLTITGVGAGGGAAVYTLASLHDLEGRITLIDPDEVEPSNMNRYVFALQTDSVSNRPKVEVAKELLSDFKKLDVRACQTSYQELISSKEISDIDVLISTVDTKETRRNIQWDMPRVILDAAVVSTDFYVRRVDIGKSPCLICTHSPKEAERPLEEILSEVTGLSASEVVKLRSTNACLTQEHINRMTKSGEKYGFALSSVGERFSDWLMMHCGELVVSAMQERFPLPFATVLPGILIAGEVIKERYFPKDVLQNYYSYDMINLPANGMTEMKPVSDCIFCSSLTTREKFAKKHG